MKHDRQIAAKSRHNFHILLHGKSKDVYQILLWCRGIITAIDVCIYNAILHSILEDQRKGWRWSTLTTAKSPQNKVITIATSIPRPQTNVKVNHLHTCLNNSENFDSSCTTYYMYVLNSGVTELNLTEFWQCGEWLLINLSKSKLWHSYPFRNASMQNEDDRHIVASRCKIALHSLTCSRAKLLHRSSPNFYTM